MVGPSGSGKTTLCSLIARFWDVQEGSVCVGGTDVKDCTADSLLKNLSMVFQNVYLFHDSIENNIKFGNPNATHEQVVEAARRAQCHDFIMALPDGYHTMVGEGGSTLSGGEKQRVSIARAILKDAPIVILDEATSSVDPENEHLLLAAIRELTAGKRSFPSPTGSPPSGTRIRSWWWTRDGSFSRTHDALMAQDGLYRRFVQVREQAEGWRLE